MPRKKQTDENINAEAKKENVPPAAEAPKARGGRSGGKKRGTKPAGRKPKEEKPSAPEAAEHKEARPAPEAEKTAQSAAPKPLYGKLTSGKRAAADREPAPAEKKERSFVFGRITPPKAEKPAKSEEPEPAEKPQAAGTGPSETAAPANRAQKSRNRRRNRRSSGKRGGGTGERKIFDRDAILAAVFGYAPDSANEAAAAPAEEKPGEVPAAPEKKESPAKKTQTEPKKEEPFDRDAILAAVFGYTRDDEEVEEVKAEEAKPEKAGGKPAEKRPAAPKRRKSGIFNIFRSAGKKKRPGFTWKAGTENEAPAAQTEPAAEKPDFDRDAILAAVFGYAEEKPAAQPEAATAETAAETAEPERKPAAPKNLEALIMLDELIEQSYTGDYPKKNIRKPLTEFEKMLAKDFETFFAARGLYLSFADGGASKTGVIAWKLFRSGPIEDVLSFFGAGKAVVSRLTAAGEKAYRKELASTRYPFQIFDPRFSSILNCAMSFGLVAAVTEQRAPDGHVVALKASFSKYRKVLDFFKGEFLEAFAYYAARNVVRRVAEKNGLKYEIATNLVATDKDGNAVHEYDTVIRLGKKIFIIEEKSASSFCDFNKFARDMDQLSFDKSCYMILLLNKNEEEAEAVEYLFDFRVANASNFSRKLEEMLTEGIR